MRWCGDGLGVRGEVTEGCAMCTAELIDLFEETGFSKVSSLYGRVFCDANCHSSRNWQI